MKTLSPVILRMKGEVIQNVTKRYKIGFKMNHTLVRLFEPSSVILKANVNSDIQMKTAAIFFLSNLYQKQGIGLVYVMVAFICIGFLELQGVRSEENKIN